MRRYSLVNMYISGSRVSPQVSHGLNNLWKDYIGMEMSENASKTFLEWATNHETEINLNGGSHGSLCEFSCTLEDLDDIPSSIFYESQDALNGSCAVVTFVADEKLCEIIDIIRSKGLSYDEARSYWIMHYPPLIELMHIVANLPLAS